MNRQICALLVLPFVMSSQGCSNSGGSPGDRSLYLPSSESRPQEIDTQSTSPATGLMAGGLADGEDTGSQSAVPPAPLDRQIVYTATVRLTVDDFATFPERLAGLVNAVGGYIGEAQVDRMQGTMRNGTWTIRVPGTRYRDFIRDVSGLGVPESVLEKANDVTDQFVDLEARISSMKQLEQQIIKLVEKQNDRIESVLSLERELARVRVDIERMQGSLRVIADRVEFSSVSLVATERQVYVATPAERLDERIGSAWSGAVIRARTWFEGVLLAVITHSFTLAGWLVFLVIFWWIAGKRIARALWRTGMASQRPATEG